MSDIKKIDETYYGKKTEWITKAFTKIPPWKSLIGGYDAGVIPLNTMLNDSIYMFGYKEENDFLYNNTVTYAESENTKFKRRVKKLEKGAVMYLYSGIMSDKSFLHTHNKSEPFPNISGYGLTSYARTTMKDKLYPMCDFNYKKILVYIYVVYISNDDTSKPTFSSTFLSDYIQNYSDKTITAYYFRPRNQLSNQSEDTLAVNWHMFPESEIYQHETFYYTNSYSVIGGGIPSVIKFNNSTKSRVYNFYGSEKNFDIVNTIENGEITGFYTVYKGTIEDIYRQACFVGLYFSDTNLGTSNDLTTITNENIYSPIIVDGLITGEYVKGKKCNELQQKDWTSDIREKSGFTGIESIDPTEYTHKISLSTPKIKSEGKFNTLYALSENEINSLSDELWSADENKLNQIIKGLLLMGENPLNCIVSLQLFPFDITSQASTTTQGRITLGATQMDTTGAKVKNLNSVIDLGSVKLWRYFDNFLDYEPYSTATLYIPYCGSVQLSLNDTIGKTISIKLIVDYNSGICTAVVFSDGIPIVYKNGVIGQQISVTGTDNSTLASNAISSSLNMLNSATNFIAGGKNVSSTIQNSANLLASSFDYSAMRTIYQTQGANSSQINMYQPQKPHIIINLAEFDVADDFGKYHGFRCDFYDFINSLTGYVETDTPILTNINATEDEKNIIIELMRGGFYV